MVFGDGDGIIFTGFTGATDVIGHELTHGVTGSEANLTYQGQSGALNESISDVFGVMVKQYKLGQTAAQAEWLIGAGILAKGIKGVALRSMKAPGSAYDDPKLGKDPQPADMAHYVKTAEDNGGVHINSGIPNHAFYLIATALDGHSWEKVGQIWYDTLTDQNLKANASFATFANTTIRHAGARYGRQQRGAEGRARRLVQSGRDQNAQGAQGGGGVNRVGQTIPVCQSPSGWAGSPGRDPNAGSRSLAEVRQSHRVERFKFSNDPQFEEKVRGHRSIRCTATAPSTCVPLIWRPPPSAPASRCRALRTPRCSPALLP